ncbi:MAG: hypothetical protein JJU34_05325 [Lunatimonas sp.]|uniref:hypothetical protein n=1 Tax=Lunatimonas sp. TaxID=2060141 RepID=UPI00263BC34E|nr:hypothetical protein [Lunatimonas sp.]MCC5936682.1 hypothetical protein [Lunatimonas sp.]
MKELSKIECVKIYGGGSVWKWFGRVYAGFLNSVDRQVEDTYQKVMVQRQIVAD